MKYYLTRGTLGSFDLEIKRSEFEYYRESNKVLSCCLSLEKSYEILILNYNDLEGEQLSWATRRMLRAVSREDFFEAILSMDRKMVNFLAAARLHIEHLQKRGGDCVNGKSTQKVKAAVKSFCDLERANTPEFKFMWDLRNEVLHANLPTHWVVFSQRRTNSFDDPTAKFEYSLNFGLLKSLSTGLGPEDLKAISGNDRVDLMLAARVYMESISNIQAKFRECVATAIIQARGKLDEAFDRYRQVCEATLTQLHLWKVNDEGDTIEESHLSSFSDDQRIRLQDMNRPLVNLRNSHVTGEQTE